MNEDTINDIENNISAALEDLKYTKKEVSRGELTANSIVSQLEESIDNLEIALDLHIQLNAETVEVTNEQ